MRRRSSARTCYGRRRKPNVMRCCPRRAGGSPRRYGGSSIGFGFDKDRRRLAWSTSSESRSANEHAKRLEVIRVGGLYCRIAGEARGCNGEHDDCGAQKAFSSPGSVQEFLARLENHRTAIS